MTRRVSYAFTSVVVAPSGNPTTVQTPAELPRKQPRAGETQVGLMHTVAKPNSRASRQSFSISWRVASAFSSV